MSDSQVLRNFSYELIFKRFQDWNAKRPSHTLIFHNNGLSWWIKVSMEGSLPTAITDLGYRRRCSTFRAFLEAIDFGRFRLLDNTVTAITLTLTEESHHFLPMRVQAMSRNDTENFYIAMSHQMRYEIEEDPDRVVYPPVSQVQCCLRIFDASCLQPGEFIAPNVSTVIFEQKKYAYKTIERPIYMPGDTQDILHEIHALAQFHGQPNIAPIAGLVDSGNPYQTNPSNNLPRVIKGFLLEYYPGGSLEQVVSEGGADTNDFSPLRWAMQVGRALMQLHKKERSHLDVKPSNVVLDAEGNAILIDIGGAGSYTWEWLSPEMRLFLDQPENYDKTLANADLYAQIATDAWAYGKMLSAIAKESGSGLVRERLQEAGNDLAKEELESRINIGAALEQLETIWEKALP